MKILSFLIFSQAYLHSVRFKIIYILYYYQRSHFVTHIFCNNHNNSLHEYFIEIYNIWYLHFTEIEFEIKIICDHIGTIVRKY